MKKLSDMSNSELKAHLDEVRQARKDAAQAIRQPRVKGVPKQAKVPGKNTRVINLDDAEGDLPCT